MLMLEAAVGDKVGPMVSRPDCDSDLFESQPADKLLFESQPADKARWHRRNR